MNIYKRLVRSVNVIDGMDSPQGVRDRLTTDEFDWVFIGLGLWSIRVNGEVRATVNENDLPYAVVYFANIHVRMSESEIA